MDNVHGLPGFDNMLDNALVRAVDRVLAGQLRFRLALITHPLLGFLKQKYMSLKIAVQASRKR